MSSTAKYFFLLVLLFVFSSCFLKRKKSEYAQENFYKDDVNQHQSPTAIAKDYASLGKKQKKAYKKQLRRTDREIKKRNKKKLKNLILKTKTKKVREKKPKDDKKSAPKEIEIK
ncbi:MAG: hypothetical protein HY063_06930 [Bacteroidetes bacterium]|nr:hypothetical protein [Bacteroidota bacterium]